MEETEVATQTDAFLDRPPTPLFVPAKTGRDVATQIEEGDVSVLLLTSTLDKIRPQVLSLAEPLYC